MNTMKVLKVGTSLGVVIPRNLLRAMKIERGDQLAFAVYDEARIIMRKLTDNELKTLRLSLLKNE